MTRISRLARATLILALMVAVTTGLAACGGASDRASVCGAFDDLGKQALSPHPFSDSIIFRKARELADQAASYEKSSAVHDEADELKSIGKSDSTSLGEIRNATTAIATLCGHPLGIGTTEPSSGTGDQQDAGTATQTTTQTTETQATVPPSSDEDQVREVMRQWGAATDPSELCSLETAEAQQAEVAKNPGPTTCEEAMSPGTAATYSSIDVTITRDDTARVEVPSSGTPSYSLRKVDGVWKIDKYGTHLDLPSPDADVSIDPESCGSGTGTPC